jgi:hypothetical protein
VPGINIYQNIVQGIVINIYHNFVQGLLIFTRILTISPSELFSVDFFSVLSGGGEGGSNVPGTILSRYMHSLISQSCAPMLAPVNIIIHNSSKGKCLKNIAGP